MYFNKNFTMYNSILENSHSSLYGGGIYIFDILNIDLKNN